VGGGGGGGGGGSSAVDGSSHVNVMLSSLSSGSLNAFRMDSVKWRYPSGPGRTSKLRGRERKGFEHDRARATGRACSGTTFRSQDSVGSAKYCTPSMAVTVQTPESQRSPAVKHRQGAKKAPLHTSL